MHASSLTLVLLPLFVAVTSAFAFPAQEPGAHLPTRTTNGERLARGLPPLRPRSLFNPDIRARTPAPSPTIYSGHLALFKSGSSTPIGYITAPTVGEYFTLQPTASESTLVTFTAAGSNPFSIVMPGVPTTPYLGWAVSNSASRTLDSPFDITSGSGTTYAYLDATSQQTTPGTPAQATQPRDVNSRGVNAKYVETGIWAYDSNSKIVTPSWINSDGLVAHNIIITRNAERRIYLQYSSTPNTITSTGPYYFTLV